jgi:hypothetical protein
MANFKFFKFPVWNKAEQMALLDLPSSFFLPIVLLEYHVKDKRPLFVQNLNISALQYIN